MNDNMSVFSLILNASFVVQLVMLILVIASVISWIMILQRRKVLSNAKKTLVEFEEQFWSGIDLTQLYRQVSSNPNPNSGAESIFRAGIREYTRMRKQTGADGEAVMEGVERAMRVAMNKEEEKLSKHLPFLATVGSVSPYIGLFGTVWGIMNSFRGLANAHQATLATVAPGISEALIATAMGLFAAIPAVMAYNSYSHRVDLLTQSYDTFAEEFTSILHRKAHTNTPS